MKITLIVLTTCLCLIANSGYANQPVKKSTTRYCHDSNSPSYDQVKVNNDLSNTFDSLDDCLNNGGKLTEEAKKRLAPNNPEAIKMANHNEQKEKQAAQYAGFNWGAGLMFATTNDALIREVIIVDGKISVLNETKNRAIAMLESHYFFVPGKRRLFGHGPFIAVGLGGEDADPLSTYGAGYMVGFRKEDEITSWNIGFGYFMDTKAQVLKNGLNDGDSTTETDSSKLLRIVDTGGWMLMFSSSF